MNPPFSDDLYHRFRDLLLARAGLFYPERKRGDLLHGLSMAMGDGRYPSIAALYADAVGGGSAWDLVVQHLTIGETYFFRNGAQFDALRQHILPEILRRQALTRSLRIWSAGCATGEEPYSLAMTIGDMLQGDTSWGVSILATDINPQFLARAREGLYGEWSFRETPDDLRARFWLSEQSRWRLRPEIRRMVAFARLNLAEPSYPSVVNGTVALDLLVCRNVTIYFDAATTRQVAERFFRALKPGGWLIIGHAEPQASVYDQFEVHNFPNTVIYRKPLDAPLFDVESRPAAPAPRPAAPAPPPAAPAPPPAAPAPRTAPAALVQLGRECANRGDWPGAAAYCAQALAQDSLLIEAHYLLAQISEHQGDLDAALTAYRRTVYLDRSFVLGLIGLGHIWRQLGRPRDARRSFEAARSHLSQLPASALVPGADGATAAELNTLVGEQLRAGG
jgi:chemotaxis protein methyltransferase CheR